MTPQIWILKVKLDIFKKVWLEMKIRWCDQLQAFMSCHGCHGLHISFLLKIKETFERVAQQYTVCKQPDDAHTARITIYEYVHVHYMLFYQ